MRARILVLTAVLGSLVGCKNEVEPDPPSPDDSEPVKIVRPELPEKPEVKAKGPPIYFENDALRLEADSQLGSVYSGNVKVQFKPGSYGVEEGKLTLAKADQLTLSDDEVLLEGNAQLQRGDSLLEGARILIPKSEPMTVDGGASWKILRMRDSASND